MTRHGLLLVSMGLVLPLLCLAGEFVWHDRVLVAGLSAEPGLQDWIDAFAGPVTPDPIALPQATHYYRPLLRLGHQLERQLIGDWVAGYRFTSLLSHLACLLFALRFIHQRVPGLGPWAVWLSAAPLAWHASRVEAAAYISGRAELWMTLLVLFAVDAARRRVLSFLTMVLTVLAVLCKETAVVLPLLIAADAWASPRRRSGDAQRPMRWGPTMASAAGVALALLVRSIMVPLPADLFVEMVSRLAADPLRPLTVLGHYLHVAIMPGTPRIAIGPVLLPHGPGPHTWIAVALVAALPLGAALSRRYPELRGVVADLAWFVIPLIPVLQLLPLHLPGLASQRLLYLPMVGLSVLIARGLAHLPRPRVFGGLVAAWVVAHAVVAVPYADAFRTDGRLWERELHRLPPSVLALEAYGQAQERAGVPSEAHDAYLTGAQLAARRKAPRTQLRLLLQVAALDVQQLDATDERAALELDAFYAAVAFGGRAEIEHAGISSILMVSAEDAEWAAVQPRLFLVPLAALRVKLDELPGAIELLDRAIEFDGRAPEAFELRVRARALTGDLRGARRDLDAARARFPRDDSLAALEAPLASSERRAAGTRGDPLVDADVALAFGDFARAARILNRAGTEHRDRLAWWRTSLRLALAEGDPARALELFEHVERRRPELVDELQGLAEEARAALTQRAPAAP